MVTADHDHTQRKKKVKDAKLHGTIGNGRARARIDGASRHTSRALLEIRK
jgi:hypothetical protein